MEGLLDAPIAGGDAGAGGGDPVAALTVLFVGVHPEDLPEPFWRRLLQHRQRHRQVRWIAIDPCRTELAELSDLHLRLLPGTDAALCNGLLHQLLWDEAVDRDYLAHHGEDLPALKRLLGDYPPRLAAEACGVPPAALLQAAAWFGRPGQVLSLCALPAGSAHGRQARHGLAQLHLATGRADDAEPVATSTGLWALAGRPDGWRRQPARAWSGAWEGQPQRPPREPVSARQPLRLLLGRAREVAEPALLLHPDDAARRGLATGTLLRVTGKSGSLLLPLHPSTRLASGLALACLRADGACWLGQADALAAGSAAAMEHAAVRIKPAGHGWHLFAASPRPLQGDALAELLAQCAHARLWRQVAADGSPLHMLRVAHAGATDAGWQDALLATLELRAGADTLHYRDPHRGQLRCVRWRGERIDTLLLAGPHPPDPAHPLLAALLQSRPWPGSRLSALSCRETP